MIFYVQYEHMMGSSGLIGFLQILKGVGSGRPPRTKSSSMGACETASIRGHAKRYRPQMKAVFWPWLSEDLVIRQPITKGHSIAFLLVSSNGARGENSVCVSRGLTPNLASHPLTDVRSRVRAFQNQRVYGLMVYYT